MSRAAICQTKPWARASVFDSLFGRLIETVELQNLNRVEAGSEVIGHEAVSRIEYSSDESANWIFGQRARQSALEFQPDCTRQIMLQLSSMNGNTWKRFSSAE